MAKNKKNRNSNKYKGYSKGNNSSTYNREDFSEEDIESLHLLEIQLRGTLIVIYGQLLLIQANFQGREVIYNKYKSNDDIETGGINNSNTTSQVTPDRTVLKATYIFFLIKLLFIQIAFTRYNTVYNKKINGEFPYSLELNIMYLLY